jgi:ribosomal protein L34E
VTYDRHWPSDAFVSVGISFFFAGLLKNFKQRQKDKSKACSCCGKKFGCTETEMCWCGDVTLTQQDRDRLKKEYDDCLCPDCLKKQKAGAV